MKKLLLCFALLVAATANAQIVNIPDAVLKYTLVHAGDYPYWSVAAGSTGNGGLIIDTNADGEIQVSEAAAVWELSITYSTTQGNAVFSAQGLEAFVNLRTLSFNGEQITSLPITNCSHLERLDCYGNNLTTLDLSGLTNLKTLNYYDNNNLSSMNVSGLVSLETMVGTMTMLTSLDLHALTNLKHIEVQSSWGPNMTITSLNVSGLPNLEYLDCSYQPLSSLDLSGLVNLKTLRCSKIPVNTIDLSASPLLELFICDDVYNPLYINLKNGSSITGIGLNYATAPVFVCIDEGGNEQASLLYYANDPHIQWSTYCTFTPGGNYNTITGNFILDDENNGCDAGDTVLPLAKITINDGTTTGTTFTNLPGNYSFYTQAGTFILTPQLYGNNWFNTAPQTVTFADNNNNTVTQNFCVTANGTHPDLAVIMVPIVPARPGFDAVYKIIYGNKGNQTLSGSASVIFNDNILDYLSASPAAAVSSVGNLTWNFTGLHPFEYRTATVVFNVNNPSETPAVNIGDVLPFTVAITPATGDETPLDNTFAYTQNVVGSFDPNDITCLEGATVDPAHIGEYLHYNINFENTGTAPATFIAVKDIIDTTKFDISSFQVLNASHNMQTRITGNKLEFYFADIDLAGGEKGNVTFKIKSLPTLAPNSVVTQQADIFFDYNAPVATNEANTTYALLSTGAFVNDASVKLYPNPAKTVVNIKASSGVQSVQLYDIQGRLLQAGSSNTLDVSARATGIYFIKITTAKGTSVEKLIKD